MIDIVNLVGGLGAGALLGLIMFFCYRQDRKATESRLTGLLQEDQESRRHNTKALTELTILLRGLNGKLKL